MVMPLDKLIVMHARLKRWVMGSENFGFLQECIKMRSLQFSGLIKGLT